MRTNVLLLRTPFGWAEQLDQTSIDAAWRVEGFLSVDRPSREACLAEASAVLERESTPTEQLTAQIDPDTVGNTPYRNPGFTPGRTALVDGSEVQVVEIVATDDGDRLSLQPKFGDRILTRDEATVSALRQGLQGFGLGTYRNASPVSPRSTVGEIVRGFVGLITFDRDEGAGDTSKPWTLPSSARIGEIHVDVPGGEAFTAQLRINGTTARTVTSAGGTQVAVLGLEINVVKGDVLTVTSDDTGFDLVFTVRFV